MTDEQLQARIKDWMEGKGEGLGLHRYLGMSWEQYCDRMEIPYEDQTETIERLKSEAVELEKMNGLLRDENDRVAGEARARDEAIRRLRAKLNREKVRFNNLHGEVRKLQAAMKAIQERGL